MNINDYQIYFNVFALFMLCLGLIGIFLGGKK